tara:strand:- start:523 stop:1188 length:666 start_codon:yes stop_codon:yes gene_type:complete
MDIAPLAAAAAPNPAKPETPDKAKVALNSDFETFLKMLTVQARNQDPLKPLDSTEYASQLAQFSMVEQQVMSNDLLTALSSHLGAGNMAQMANWIGMEARTTAPVHFDGTPITLTPRPTAAADEAAVIVRNAEGVEVQRIAVPTAAQPFRWTGTGSDGTLPTGNYSFALESRAVGKVIEESPLEAYGRVTEAQIDGGATTLILQGGSKVAATDVTGLRDPA